MEHLTLDANQLGDHSLKTIFESPTQCQNLKTLSVRSTNIQNKDLTWLLEQPKPKNLTQLNLQYNPLTPPTHMHESWSHCQLLY